MEQSFLEFITAKNNKQIIKVLCRIRAREADRLGCDDKIKKLSSKYKGPSDKHKYKLPLIYQIMPPRRHWVQLGWEERTRETELGRQRISSSDYNTEALYKTIHMDRKRHLDSLYLKKLDTFITNFLKWVKNDKICINNIRIIPLPKKYEKEKVECRPVTVFSDLSESILLVLINKYLTRQFDAWFYDESLAFRAKRMYHGVVKSTTHHDAVERISEYRDKFSDKDIFVAECDMKKFYDTVSHRVVRKSFNALFKKLEDKTGYKYDLEKRIVGAFLNCYTFPRNVLKLNNSDYWKERGIKGYFRWVEKELTTEGLYKKSSVKRAKIGVPQGGALSGLIANAVLDSVDKQVEALLTDEDLYLRYCDDMILMSTDKDRCVMIFEEYQKSLKTLRLIPHQPSRDIFDKKKYWSAKTKLPYKWALGEKDSPEWIGFVGYEIKRDGCIRIRKGSLKKEIKKQRKYTTELFKKLKGLKRVGDDTINASITNHLINMSVGRVTIWNANSVQHDLCWINGFRGLNDNKYARRQVCVLDQFRNKTICMATSKFVNQRLSEESIEKYKNGSKKKDERLSGAIRFYGKPFSYYYHYTRMAKKEIKMG